MKSVPSSPFLVPSDKNSSAATSVNPQCIFFAASSSSTVHTSTSESSESAIPSINPSVLQQIRYSFNKSGTASTNPVLLQQMATDEYLISIE